MIIFLLFVHFSYLKSNFIDLINENLRISEGKVKV